VIAAPPEAVFANINDFHNWDAWSPWAKRDPNAKATFSGAPAGKGAVLGWSGNSDVGEGSMTIVESRPAQAVGIKLAFAKPMQGEADAAFALKPEGSGTHVTWTLNGRSSFIDRAICTLMGGMERILGPDYEKGLANLKAVTEAQKG
ncbi:MAG: SRPBCC family protein, partial [Hyphomicrobiaceae bacterium]